MRCVVVVCSDDCTESHVTNTTHDSSGVSSDVVYIACFNLGSPGLSGAGLGTDHLPLQQHPWRSHGIAGHTIIKPRVLLLPRGLLIVPFDRIPFSRFSSRAQHRPRSGVSVPLAPPSLSPSLLLLPPPPQALLALTATGLLCLVLSLPRSPHTMSVLLRATDRPPCCRTCSSATFGYVLTRSNLLEFSRLLSLI